MGCIMHYNSLKVTMLHFRQSNAKHKSALALVRCARMVHLDAIQNEWYHFTPINNAHYHNGLV